MEKQLLFVKLVKISKHIFMQSQLDSFSLKGSVHSSIGLITMDVASCHEMWFPECIHIFSSHISRILSSLSRVLLKKNFFNFIVTKSNSVRNV